MDDHATCVYSIYIYIYIYIHIYIHIIIYIYNVLTWFNHGTCGWFDMIYHKLPWQRKVPIDDLILAVVQGTLETHLCLGSTPAYQKIHNLVTSDIWGTCNDLPIKLRRWGNNMTAPGNMLSIRKINIKILIHHCNSNNNIRFLRFCQVMLWHAAN